MRRKRIDEISEDLKYCEEKGVPYAYYSSLAAGTPADATTEADPQPGAELLTDPRLAATIRDAVEQALRARESA